MARLVKKGEKLEMLLEMTHNQYRSAGIADIDKIPPPLKVGKVTGKNVKAYLDKGSWVDYAGVCRGVPIIFDAKETTVERLPLSNIADHQYEKLKIWHKHRAASFLIVGFWLKDKNEPEIYLLDFEQLAMHWEDPKIKSIPIKYFRENCSRVIGSNGFTVDYLHCLGLRVRRAL